MKHPITAQTFLCLMKEFPSLLPRQIPLEVEIFKRQLLKSLAVLMLDRGMKEDTAREIINGRSLLPKEEDQLSEIICEEILKAFPLDLPLLPKKEPITPEAIQFLLVLLQIPPPRSLEPLLKRVQENRILDEEGKLRELHQHYVDQITSKKSQIEELRIKIRQNQPFAYFCFALMIFGVFVTFYGLGNMDTPIIVMGFFMMIPVLFFHESDKRLVQWKTDTKRYHMQDQYRQDIESMERILEKKDAYLQQMKTIPLLDFVALPPQE